ncbi:MAG: hypothetical protein EKK31_07630 [Hyphomicrobiales bacterium]|nr:MAG: hypothetical protein EKK31_07630 [Hyphomicrobiales bacterium]
MQFLVISSRRTEHFSDEDFQALVGDEGTQARVLYGKDFTRQIWHRADVAGACQIVEAKDEAEARNMLATLPFAKANMIEFQIIPLKPYAGFL